MPAVSVLTPPRRVVSWLKGTYPRRPRRAHAGGDDETRGWSREGCPRALARLWRATSANERRATAGWLRRAGRTRSLGDPELTESQVVGLWLGRWLVAESLLPRLRSPQPAVGRSFLMSHSISRDC